VSNSSTYIFTDIDLDGVGSLIAIHQVLGAKPGDIKFTAASVSNIRKELLRWLETDSFVNYTNVYFLDLDTSEIIDLIDAPNVIIIDHHNSHAKNADKYKRAQVMVTVTTSCSKLIYRTYKDKLSHLTDAQKYFIALCDDYDSYVFKLPDSYNLNCLFTNTQKSPDKSRTHKFLERFYEGFNQFTVQEANIIKDYIERKNAAIAGLKIFEGKVSIGKQDRYIVGTHGEKFTNEICHHLIEKHNAEIAFFYNINSNHVSWRKSKTCEIDLSKLAAKLCQGGGHEYAAGGQSTPAFFEFTKSLTPKI